MTTDERGWRLPAHVAEQVEAAQVRVYKAASDAADARAMLASAEAEFGQAMADLNRAINFVLGYDDGKPPGVA